jgi:2-oxoglutarate dehydrogenase E1 component
VLCSGKVFYDLDAARESANDPRVAVVRLEQFYPFPANRLKEVIASYPNADQIFWTQEEPQNMGGWNFVEGRLRSLKPENFELRFVGRAPSASPATGSYAIHELEQKQIVDSAMIVDTGEIAAASEPEVSEKLAPAGA